MARDEPRVWHWGKAEPPQKGVNIATLACVGEIKYVSNQNETR